VAVALLVAAQVAYPADDLVVEAWRRGGSIEVRARATLAAPAPLVWQVLTDYETLPRFIPGISKSLVRARQGNHLTIEQSGEARFFVFSFPIEVTLEVLESPSEWISSRAVSGNVRRMNGRYELTPDSRGSVQLRYSGLIEPAFDLPPLIGAAALRSTVEEQFTAMVAEIERRAAAGR
jgi:ribosome-associated toxin RatA of RatAB toxin-antitoxin module